MKDVLRLLDTNLAYSQYLDGPWAQRAVATMLKAYRLSDSSSRWQSEPFLARLGTGGSRFGMVLAAIFDYVTNVEYCSARLGRVTDSKWIYCNAAKDGGGATAAGTCARVFYSFLKQCPYCCLHVGLGARIEGAQHKPASHHIGEITGSLIGMLLAVITQRSSNPLRVGLVTKQSHSVDIVVYGSDLAVLVEVKASPLVTLPLACDLPAPMTYDGEEGVAEYPQHRLVDFLHRSAPLYFLLPNTERRVELGTVDGAHWPYPRATAYVATADGFLDYLSSWAELYCAYAVPKTQRQGRVESVAYVTNGWGDEIDSNKTKPGLGRTDDVKKGTYQVLKFGAYYKDLCKKRRLYTALVANLDPVNLWADYLQRLLDVRWTKDEYVRHMRSMVAVSPDRLYYLFEALVAFNRPRINEPVLQTVFNLDAANVAALSGALDAPLLDGWLAP